MKTKPKSVKLTINLVPHEAKALKVFKRLVFQRTRTIEDFAKTIVLLSLAYPEIVAAAIDAVVKYTQAEGVTQRDYVASRLSMPLHKVEK